MKFGSLFAGIGGIDLGLERAGMECAWQVEVDDYCQRVLAKHWPDVERFADVKEVHGVMAHAEFARRTSTITFARDIERGTGKSVAKGAGRKEEDFPDQVCPFCLPPVDLIAGGFPCQPHSVAGKRKGAADDRNLWPEFSRIIAELQPRFVLAENVPGIITTYLDTVLSDLEGQGYACGTFNLPAVAFDAPHRRERIFVVAHRVSGGGGRRTAAGESDGQRRQSAEAERARLQSRNGEASSDFSQSGSEAVADTAGRRCEQRQPQERGLSEPYAESNAVRNSRSARRSRNPRRGNGSESENRRWWTVEPDVCGVADGLSRRLDGGIGADQRRIQVSRAEASRLFLRRVWNYGELEYTPRGQGLSEQFAREYPHAVRVLPYETPLGNRQEAVAEISTLLCRMRKAINARAVRNASLPLEEAWESLSAEDQDWVRMGALRGPWWSEWPDTPRVEKGVPARVDRLRGLGNAVVPQVAEWIGRRIMEIA